MASGVQPPAGSAKRVSIEARLLIAACAPLLAALLCAATIVYVGIKGDQAADLTLKARLVASALAESAQYDFLQGDRAAARRSMQAVLAAEPSVRQITLLDAGRTPLLAFGEVPKDEPYESVEVALQQVDSGQEHVPRHKGYVRVFISSPQLSSSKRSHLLEAGIALFLVGVASVAAAVSLVRRVSVPLENAARCLHGLSKFEVEQARLLPLDGVLGDLHGSIRTLAQHLTDSQERGQAQLTSQTRDLHALLSATAREAKDKQRLLDYGDKLIEKERERIASEIHDQLGGGLVSIRLQAEALARKAKNLGQEGLESIARQIVSTLTELYDGTRSITRQLRPEVLEMLGLGGAIEEMVRQLDESHPQCRFKYQPISPVPDPKGEYSITAFRVVQEALTNIIKHAKAKNVDVTLSSAEGPRHLRIVVADDGQGMEKSKGEGTGLGMMGMQERVERVGGVMSIKSDGTGTVLTFVL